MRNCITTVIMAVILSVSTLAAQGAVLHEAPSNTGAQVPLTLEAIVQDPSAAVEAVMIFYRPAGETAYRETEMADVGGNLFYGTIPAIDIAPPAVEYYIVASLANGSILAFPDENPEIMPIEVVVSAQQEGYGITDIFADAAGARSDVLILAPEPMEIVLDQDLVIAASLFNVPNVDVSTVKLFLDGRDVTALSEVSVDLITFTPGKLPSGAHQIEITFRDLSGTVFEPTAWRFLVTTKASVSSERAFKQSGKITSSMRRDAIDNNVLAVQDIKFQYRAGWDWLRIRSNLKLSSEEDPFKPARNRYSASFETDYFQLGLGDVSPSINRFALEGKRIRGFDANLLLKYFNLRITKGELERSIQGPNASAYQLDSYRATYIDSNGVSQPGLANLSRSGYAFRRDVLAVRPSFGSGRVFELAFSYVKAKDNIASVDKVMESGVFEVNDPALIDLLDLAPGDTSANGAQVATYRDLEQLSRNSSGDFEFDVLPDDWNGSSPQDNLVLGSDLTLALNKRRFVIQTGFAFSMLNRNIWEPVLTIEGLDTLMPDDDDVDGYLGGEFDLSGIPEPATFEEHFIVSNQQVPLVPIDIETFDILKMPSLAYYATAKFNYLKNFITLEMQQVGPDFNSLANPNVQKNVRVRSISDRLRMFNNRLMVTAKFRTTDDDIVKLEGQNVTSTSTLSLGGNLNLGAGLPAIAVNYRNYNRNNGITEIDTTDAGSTLHPDSLSYRDRREDIATSALNLNFMYNLELLGTQHNINLSITNLKTLDLYDDRAAVDRENFSLPNSPAANSSTIAIGINSNISSKLTTTVGFDISKAELGDPETGDLPKVFQGDTTLVRGFIAQDLTKIELGARYRLGGNKMLVRGSIFSHTSTTDRSKSDFRPDPSTKFGFRGGFEMEIIDNLQLVTAFEFRKRTVDLRDAGTEELPASIFSANLRYKF
ncbi:hypothetical protein ACFL6E_04700 [Candidatus Neomarinimicrobiota bacterium]